MGCLLALMLWRWPLARPSAGTGCWLGLAGAGAVALVLYAEARLPPAMRWLHWAGYTVLALAFAAAVAHLLVSPTSLPARALRSGPLAWVGRVSYGLYLWHVPVFRVPRSIFLAAPPLLEILMRSGAALAIAAASFYLVERPFLRWKSRLGGVPVEDQTAPVGG